MDGGSGSDRGQSSDTDRDARQARVFYSVGVKGMSNASLIINTMILCPQRHGKGLAHECMGVHAWCSRMMHHAPLTRLHNTPLIGGFCPGPIVDRALRPSTSDTLFHVTDLGLL